MMIQTASELHMFYQLIYQGFKVLLFLQEHRNPCSGHAADKRENKDKSEDVDCLLLKILTEEYCADNCYRRAQDRVIRLKLITVNSDYICSHAGQDSGENARNAGDDYGADSVKEQRRIGHIIYN